MELIRKKMQKMYEEFHLKIKFYKWKKYIYIIKRVDSDRSNLDLADETIIIYNFPHSQKLW